MNTNFFESKKFSIILAGLLLILLAISGFVLLGDSNNGSNTISETLTNTDEKEKANRPFKPEKEQLDANYEEELSKQYEEYNKVKADKEPKKEVSTQTPPTKSPSASNGGGSTTAPPSKGSSTNEGASTPSSKPTPTTPSKPVLTKPKPSDSSDSVKQPPQVALPPINVGDKNPTVPKLPNKPAPKPSTDTSKDDTKVPPTKPTDGKDTTPTKPSDGKDTPTTPPPAGGDTSPVKTTDDLSAIKPTTRPPSIDLAPHEQLTDSQLSGKTSLPMTGTTYWGDLRIQPIKVERDTYGITATIEVGNLSSKPLSIDESNFSWLYQIPAGNGVEEGTMATTSIQGSPLVVQPNSTGLIKVSTAYEKASILEVKLQGLDHQYMFPYPSDRITDAKPLNGADVFEVNGKRAVEALHVSHLVGSQNFKLEPLGAVTSQLSKLGPIDKSSKGSIGVVKVRFANTSGKEISLEKIQLHSVNYQTEKWHTIDYPLKDLSLIGGNTFPTKIAARTVVEGYLPFFSDDTNHASLVYVETSAEEFYVSNVETYSPYGLLQ